MAAQNLSRKRPAPGAEPVGYSQPIQQQPGGYGNNTLGPMSNDEFLQWGQAPAQPQNTFQDPTGFGSNPQPFPPNNMPASNQLTRRPMNQIATRPDTNGNTWLPEPNAAPPPATNGDWEDDIDDLEQKAQAAKRDATAKRKQIPPFVLKLRSFVEDPKSNGLIRWTEDGKSFVVLDEDEFAKKLIPELFKHNNYASFVRQLNMYGFHKKVGLSDNSMRASERKAKSPNEYSNPYFRRGYPDLMWLIQKPKNVTASSKGKGRNKQEGDAIEEDDEINDELPNEGRARPRPQLTLGDEPTNSMTQETLMSVQRELQVIRRQQNQISQMMGALKREHEQLYSQAVTFQDQHTRHENSINAILTFLATIYNRNLSGNEGVQGIANMFGASLPQDTNKSGTVVDVGDYNFDQFPVMNDMSNKPFKKQPLLLTDGTGRATTMSPASTNSPMMQSSRRTPQKPSPNSPQIQEVFDTGNHDMGNSNNTINNTNNQSLGSRSRANGGGQRQQDMMAMIENTNARNPSPTTPVADFTNVLNDLENSRGNVPLSNTQRENVLRMINNSANQSGDNALVNHSPPSGPANFDRHLATTKADLDALARMQAQQDHSVAKLTNLLQPLSPSGSIPGIDDGQVFSDPPPDADDFFRSQDYLNYHNGNGDFNFTGDNDGPSYSWNNISSMDNDDDDELFAESSYNNNNNTTSASNFNNNSNQDYTDPGNFLSINTDNDGGGRVQSIASSEATTPQNGGVVGPEDDFNFSSKGKGRKLSTVEDDTNNNNKRRRKS